MAISDLKRFRSLEQENQAIMIARLARADRMCAKGSGATGKRTGSVHVCWRSNVPWMCMHQHHGPPQRRRASDPDRYGVSLFCVCFVRVCLCAMRGCVSAFWPRDSRRHHPHPQSVAGTARAP